MSEAKPTPLVSVLLPVFNGERYIETALRSVINQTFRDLEIIVIDDGSADGTSRIVSRIADQHDEIKILKQRNAGQSAAFCTGLAAARGAWIAQIDADDEWRPTRLECLLEYKSAFDVISDDLAMVYAGRPGVAYSFLRSHGYYARAARQISFRELVKHDLGMLKPIFRREFVDQKGIWFEAERRRTYDFQLSARLLAAKARWLLVPRTLYVYNVHASNRSKNTVEVAKGVIKSVDDLLADDTVREDPSVLRYLAKRKAVWLDNLESASLVHSFRNRRYYSCAASILKPSSTIRLLRKSLRAGYRRALLVSARIEARH